MSRVRSPLLLFLLALLAISLVTWPAVLHLPDHLGSPIDHPDTQVGVWWPQAVADSLVHLRSPFWRPELNWPDGQDTRLLLWNCTVQTLFAPISLLASPVLALNLTLFLILALDGLASAWAAWVLTEDRLATVVALIVGATSSYAFTEGSFGRPEQALWAPIAVYLGALGMMWRSPGTWRPRLVAGVSLGVAGAIYWFYAYFLVVSTLVVAGAWVLNGALSRRRFVDLLWVAGVSLVVVSPALWFVVSGFLQNRAGFEGVRGDHGEPVMLQAANAFSFPRSYLGGWVHNPLEPSDRLPVLAVPVMALAAWRAPARVRLVAWVGLLGAILAAGPVLQTARGDMVSVGGSSVPLPMMFVDLLPGFRRFWWPYRWQAVAGAAYAVALGWIVVRVRWRLLVAGVVVAFHLVDAHLILRGGITMMRQTTSPVQVPAIFAALASLPGEHPVLQIPIATHPNSQVGWQAFHRQPIDGGIAWQMDGVRPESYARRRNELPLWTTLAALTRGEQVAPRERWTVDDTGGFEYVMMYPDRRIQADTVLIAATSEQLGDPIWEGPQVVVWAVPGVAVVPLPVPTQDAGHEGPAPVP